MRKALDSIKLYQAALPAIMTGSVARVSRVRSTVLGDVWFPSKVCTVPQSQTPSPAYLWCMVYVL